ncbi:exopolysaccharide biosynthesis polyprenyl glycosylphosphotransferase [Actinobacillus equuli subsp. haemolyticus]|uniref:exopolysaccharide biosynthesis polyprenyl glycosylphosphotransferase n=1 Tax=Actinobacillus equuli TaxID=718 RepID=UPI002441E245|nr:exopolysaccharide biosynthesis polyprenyl glycosylphosphotransferase [Actinobacillus equuli]WGE67479.1 exopolysaccharide biosynthesis polyprenyl glycosylphosphotransferase [Actinobacillus equuli subsp. haemolyticus]
MRFIICGAIAVFLPAFILSIFADLPEGFISHSIFIGAVCYVFHLLLSHKLSNYPGKHENLILLPSVIVTYSFSLVVITLFQVTYSVAYFVCHILLVIGLDYWSNRMKYSGPNPTIHYIPLGKAKNLEQIPNVNWVKLEDPNQSVQNMQTLVADLYSPKLTDEWERFISKQTLAGVDTYNVRQIRESLTGRTKITHMYENDLGSLQPSVAYLRTKQFIDSVLVLLSFPLVLPMMLITAILIKLESEGPVLFIQKRIGQKGEEFSIYKFRSMCKDSEKDGAKLATVGDMRVTRVGKFIRKTRIDELPQFFNVLKGDMALIGPRPEQKAFVEQFDQNIPFYNYRHIVKPGITGWAQVTHGYAATEDETQVKIEHDFYYIRHFSFALDVLIFFKTIQTMLTGFGAR